MNNVTRALCAGVLVAFAGGCGGSLNPFARTNTKALAQTQQDKFQALADTLKQQKKAFHDAMELLADSDDARRQRILAWRRDLVKTDVLLQVPGTAKQKEELLLIKMAQLDLDTGHEVAEQRKLDRERQKAVEDLYDRLIDAAEKLPGNGQKIVDYLGSSDPQFLAESVDVGAIVRVTAAVQDLDRKLRGLAARSDEQRKKDSEKLEKDLDTARDVIVKALNARQ